MKTIAGIQSMKLWTRRQRAAGQKIAFVPTMGFLHEGHLSLLRRARREADSVVMSVFVNPLQFGPGEDYERYPRDTKKDRRLASREACDVFFTPSVGDLYPTGFRTVVSVGGFEDVLCGASRPGHFVGVATVVLKLLNVVQPHVLLLGQKDAQQAIAIGRMLRDLDMDVRLIVCPTVREPDGLAMSSRNNYLSPDERRRAAAIYRTLLLGKRLIREGGARPGTVVSRMKAALRESGITRIDYVSIVSVEDLAPAKALKGNLLVAVAARVGKARLIDNIEVRART
ncbi:MAG: pantoate--beta-alanine ligase [Candidatus Eisenbacteria bacterium]